MQRGMLAGRGAAWRRRRHPCRRCRRCFPCRARRPFSCEPPNMKWEKPDAAADVERAHALRAMELVGGKRQEIHAERAHLEVGFCPPPGPHPNAPARRARGPSRPPRAAVGSPRFRCWPPSPKPSPRPAATPRTAPHPVGRPACTGAYFTGRDKSSAQRSTAECSIDGNHRRARADEAVHRMQRRVHALGAAAGENDFIGFRADPFGHLAARVVDRPRAPAARRHRRRTDWRGRRATMATSRPTPPAASPCSRSRPNESCPEHPRSAPISIRNIGRPAKMWLREWCWRKSCGGSARAIPWPARTR